jgi:hypothetical protein
VYLQLHHQFLLIDKLWKTGWVLLLQVTYVIKLFLEIALLASNLMLVFYIHSLPVPHSPFHGAFSQEKLFHWFLFSHCWFSFIILVQTNLFIQLLYLLFQLRNALSFELFVQLLVNFFMFLWGQWIFQKRLNIIEKDTCPVDSFWWADMFLCFDNIFDWVSFWKDWRLFMAFIDLHWVGRARVVFWLVFYYWLGICKVF